MLTAFEKTGTTARTDTDSISNVDDTASHKTSLNEDSTTPETAVKFSKRGKGKDIYGFMDNIQKGLDQVTDMENNGGDGSVLYRQIKANFIGQLSQAGVSKAWLNQNADAVLGDMKSKVQPRIPRLLLSLG